MKTAYIICGMAFGDEAKGATVDFLTRLLNAGLVVRFNGGPQAAHTVVLPSGQFHMFKQFGAGTFAGADTHLSRFTLVSPKAMMDEEVELRKFGIRDLWNRTTVDGHCVIVTPFHQAVNRILEYSRGFGRHGSCGLGVGQARSNHLQYGEAVLFARDLKDEKATKAKLIFLQSMAYKTVRQLSSSPEFEVHRDLLIDPDAINWCWDLYKEWPARVTNCEESRRIMGRYETVIFEGAQGVLLDETHGTAPFNTWTNCTFDNAMTLLSGMPPVEIHRVGCFRTYYTRHGAGPFPTEDPTVQYPELHNGTGVYQGEFRMGTFDWTSARYAIDVAKPTELALSHLDCGGENMIGLMEGFLKLPVTLTGWGPDFGHRSLCRRTDWQASEKKSWSTAASRH